MFGYYMFAAQSTNWLPAFGQFLEWLRHPTIQVGILSLPAWPAALGGMALVFLVGAMLSLALLPLDEFDRSSGKLLAFSGLLGLSCAGFGVQIAASVGVLHPAVPIVWMIGVGMLAAVAVQRKFGSLAEPFMRARMPAPKQSLPVWEAAVMRWVVAVTALMVLSSGFHALAFPITEWDSLIYHAGTAKLWYLHQPAPPTIAGPSVGIEMSYYFPGLFPGIGVFFYLLTGGIHDIYLRLMGPIFGVIAIVLTYHAARRIGGSSAGIFAAGLLALTPLFFMYTTWPTAYAPLMALLIGLFGCLEGLKRRRHHGYLITAGLLAGLIGNVSYLALFVFGYLVVIMLVWIFRGKPPLGHLAMAIVLAVIVASPTYVRNLLRLGDPFFPYGYAVFQSPYVPDLSILRDSLAEISNNALGYWPGGPGHLIVKQIKTILLDKTLLPVGSLFGIVGLALIASRARTSLAFHASWFAFLISLQMLQGWFWLRTLTMVLPSLAILSGVAFATITSRRVPATSPGDVTEALSARAGRLVVGVLLIVVSLFPGLTLAWAGPNQETWTTFLSPRHEYGRPWRYIGQPEQWLRLVHSGDYDAWQWLVRHLGSTGRVASLENRWYYLRHETLLYLDGLEAIPLYRLADPVDIERFLRDRGVVFILAPAWSEYGQAKFPIVRRLPLYRHLGTANFPLIAIFRMHGSDYYTRIYGVGRAGLDPGVLVQGGERRGDATHIRAWAEDARLVLTAPKVGNYVMEVEYLDNATEPIEVNYIASWDPLRWARFGSLPRTGTGKWTVQRLVMTELPNVVVLGPYSRAATIVIRRARLQSLASESVITNESDIVVLGRAGRFLIPLNSGYQPLSGRVVIQVPQATQPLRLRARAAGHQISLELWQGKVTDHTDWWEHYTGVARAPALPTRGEPTPSLAWNPISGTYTLMVVIWDTMQPPDYVLLEIDQLDLPATPTR